MLVYNVESISTKLESVIKKLTGPEMKAHTEFIKTNVVKCANLEGYKAAEILENYKSPNEVVFFDKIFAVFRTRIPSLDVVTQFIFTI